jgi:hypothetical protein
LFASMTMRSAVLGSVVMALLVGCGGGAREATAPSAKSGGVSYASEAAPAGYAPSTPAADMPAPAAAPPPPAAPPPSGMAKMPVATVQELPPAGQLTAGVWDDNRNFDFFEPYALKLSERDADHRMFGKQELESAKNDALGSARAHDELDVQLLLDTTGSMGDELSYLQSEFDAIAKQVRAKYPNVTPHWSLVVYRDHGDAYVTRAFDFTTDTTRFRENLRAQHADGGGDTPEAVVEGMTTALAQHWRGGANVAKLAFWVADAPAHPGEAAKLAERIREAKAKGVHVYPIASSDADDDAEYEMRSAAQITGGRYVFLTNDSGIGHSHAEPHIPCYNVTRLDHAVVRMIDVEMSGKYVEAAPAQLVRRIGAPNEEGKCRLASGMLVASY